MTRSRRPRFRRNTLRREQTRPLTAVISGLVVVAAIVGFITLSVRAPRGVPLLGFKTVYAVVPDSGNLRIHSEVRLRGVRVGEVVNVQPSAGEARLQIKVDPGQLANIPADSRAAIRGRGLLGSRLVDLLPGTSKDALGNRATLRAATNPLTLSVADTLETFNADTRGALGDMIGELGAGTLGRGRGLNAAIRVQPGTDTQLTAAFDELLKAPRALQTFVPSLDSAAGATNDARDQIVGLLRPAAAAAKPVADHTADVRQLLTEAPPALSAARPALDDGQRLLASVRRFSGSVARTLPKAPGGLRATTALLRESPPSLARATTLLKAVRPAVPAVLKITSSVRPLLAPAGRLLSDATPAVATVGRFGCDIVNFGGNWRSVLNQAVSGTNSLSPLTAFRVEALASPESVSGFVSNGQLGLSGDNDIYQPPCTNAVDKVYSQRSAPVTSPTPKGR